MMLSRDCLQSGLFGFFDITLTALACARSWMMKKPNPFAKGDKGKMAPPFLKGK